MSLETSRDQKSHSYGVESARVALLLAVVFLQVLIGSRLEHKPLTDCLTQPFWSDEFHTLLLVEEERADQLLYKLSRGADYNPPSLFLTLWAISKVIGPPNEVMLRSFSCLIGVCGLVAIYFLLRQSFSWGVAWVAVLGIWAGSPLLAYQMFEGRFYSYWFATCAILCLLLNRPARKWWHAAAVGLTAALMCTIHYFGIITLALIVAAQYCCNPPDRRHVRLLAIASIAGAVALAASIPLYVGQRAALPVPTWVAPVSLRNIRPFLGTFALSYALVLPVLCWALQELLASTVKESKPYLTVEMKRYAAPCGLFLLPAVLVAFSYLVQPVNVDRYALPAVIAYGPLIALIAQRMEKLALLSLALAFFVIGLQSGISPYSYGDRPDYSAVSELSQQIDPAKPLVVHSRFVGYPLYRYARLDPHAVRISFLYRGDQLNQIDALEQAVGIRLAEMFAVPKPILSEELSSFNEFLLMVPDGEEVRYRDWAAEPQQRFEMPAHSKQKNLRVFHMTRSPKN